MPYIVYHRPDYTNDDALGFLAFFTFEEYRAAGFPQSAFIADVLQAEQMIAHN